VTRPHEDLQRHTPADHRPGGAPVTFAPGAWCAIDIAHMRGDRVDAGTSTYETLIEKARASSTHARAAVVLSAVNKRRVIAVIGIEGHDAFRHLQSAWDDHHLYASRHAVAESSSLALYRVAASAGDPSLDPVSTDAYAFEQVAHGPDHTRGLIPAIASAANFRGALVFGSDDASASAIVYRFVHAADLDAFRQGAAARQILGSVGATGESSSGVRIVRTFG
jgi:hypothetical protein